MECWTQKLSKVHHRLIAIKPKGTTNGRCSFNNQQIHSTQRNARTSKPGLSFSSRKSTFLSLKSSSQPSSSEQDYFFLGESIMRHWGDICIGGSAYSMHCRWEKSTALMGWVWGETSLTRQDSDNCNHSNVVLGSFDKAPMQQWPILNQRL